MQASGGGYTETVKLLIANKADVNAKSKYGDTAMMLAADFGYTRTVELLKAAGVSE